MRASIRTRLWLGAAAVAIFMGTIATAWMVGPDRNRSSASLGLDFIAFYTAGTFVREGRSAELYDLPAVRKFEHELAEREGIKLGDAIGPWWNPPFYAWVFVPISKLPYHVAVRLWIAINLACAAIAVAMLCRMLAEARRTSPSPLYAGERAGVRGRVASCAMRSPAPHPNPLPCVQGRGNKSAALNTPSALDYKGSEKGRAVLGTVATSEGFLTFALVPVLLLLSVPFIHSITHGQNSCTSLLLVTSVVVFWRTKRAFMAGLVAGALFYKPQLAAVLAAVLVFDLGWRALAGILGSGAVLLLATLALPGTLHDFIHRMPANLLVVQERLPYVWERHVTFLGFWRVMLQGTGVGQTSLLVRIISAFCMGGIGIALFASAWRNTRRSNNDSVIRRDRLIASTIAATPLLMPFYFDYDQVLLAVPAVLLAVECRRRARAAMPVRIERWIIGLWSFHYVWLMLNPEIALLTRVNLAVPIWTAVALLFIVRAGQKIEETNRAEIVPVASGELNEECEPSLKAPALVGSC